MSKRTTVEQMARKLASYDNYQWLDYPNARQARKLAEYERRARELQAMAVEKSANAIEYVRELVVEATLVGFNYKDGNWPEKMFASQAVTLEALRDAGRK